MMDVRLTKRSRCNGETRITASVDRRKQLIIIGSDGLSPEATDSVYIGLCHLLDLMGGELITTDEKVFKFGG